MRFRWLVLIVASEAWVLTACSGNTDTSSTPLAGSGGVSTGGSGNQGGSCPSDLQLVAGAGSCLAVLDTCQTGHCLRAEGSWSCSGPCPCPDGWQCVPYPDQSPGCAPSSLASCLSPAAGGSAGKGGAGGNSGTGGVGGVGASGGSGGVGGSNWGGASGWGGTSGWGGASGWSGAGGAVGGSGGTGPCSGHPACPVNVAALFCDDSFLLECSVGQDCPKPTQCASNCSGCMCHVAPPVNGALNAGCDTCQTDYDCTGGLKCLEDPMLKGSGAKTCTMN